MTGAAWILAVCLIGVIAVGFAERRHRLAAERQLSALRDVAERLDATRMRLRAERRRVRRSHRIKRRAQRVVAMARAISGCRDAGEAAQRAARAIVDGFGATNASIWSVGGDTRCLAMAGEADGTGTVRVVTLRGDERDPVAELHVEFDSKRRMPAGLQAYAAVLGTVLGVCDWPFEQTSGAVDHRAPSVARAA